MFSTYKFIKEELPASVKLLIVTKKRESKEIKPLLKQGFRCFGESQVKEAFQKWFELKKEFPEIKLHMIGHLQSNKIKKALKLFDVIETIDSFDKAQLVAKAMKNCTREVKFYVQVNIGNEKQKYGILPNHAKDLVNFCRKQLSLEICGLMCIPPQNEDPLPYFNQMKIYADECEVKNLSMGMSKDYKQAIKAGATEIRLGSIIFE